MSRDRTPQAKKHHSLTRDRRNTYGEHDKSSRTAIRQRKRLASRLRRQALRRALERSAATAEDAGVDSGASDTPLGVVLHRRRLRRFERALRDRVRDDPTFLDRLGPPSSTTASTNAPPRRRRPTPRRAPHLATRPPAARGRHPDPASTTRPSPT
jgi:hypothetical protein